LTPCEEGMGIRIPSVQKRKETLTVLADVQIGECQHSVHKTYFLQDIHEQRMCQHPSTPTSLAFRNRGMIFKDYISGGSKISSTSVKLRNVL